LTYHDGEHELQGHVTNNKVKQLKTERHRLYEDWKRLCLKMPLKGVQRSLGMDGEWADCSVHVLQQLQMLGRRRYGVVYSIGLHGSIIRHFQLASNVKADY